MRLVYLGSPEAAVPPLQALVAAGHEVVLVVSMPDRRRGRGGATSPTPVKVAALELGLDVTDQLDDLLDDYATNGVHNLLALFGDPPADGSDPGGDFEHAVDLVELVRSHPTPMSVAVAAHPEGHPRSPDLATDRKYLAAKLQAADLGITQFFFDADDYFRMVDDLAALGCDTPVLPGVMPLANPTAIKRFADMAGARFPEELAARVEAAEGDDRHRIVVDAVACLSQQLLDGGVPGLHLYCLNRSAVVLDVVEQLGSWR